jgi:hypothetical protein
MKIRLFAVIATVLLIIFAADSNAFAQKGGKGGGGGKGHGKPDTAGPTSSSTMDKGSGKQKGLENASTKSKGRSDAGQERARLAKDKANKLTDNDLNRYRGISKKLGTTPEEMRARYQAAVLANPNLTYGNFVSANVIADNAGGRFPNVTSENILSGLANGDSLGGTLRNLRLTKEQATIMQRDADDKINSAIKNPR